MVAYNYIVHSDDGRILKSHCQAVSEAALHSQLEAMGYKISSIVRKPASKILGQRKRIKSQDIVSMCRRFSVMYSAGLDLMDCLSSLAKENESKKLSDILQDIHDSISKGSDIAEAFSKYPNVFSVFFINMIRAGETTGKFNDVLRKLTVYVEKQYELKRKIRGALAYPLVVLVMIFLVVTVMILFVVPVFSEVYMKLSAELPGPTVALIFISNNAAYILPCAVVLAGGLWVLYKKARTIPAIRSYLDRMKLSIPLVGPVYHKAILLRFLHTLSLTISAGILLSDAVLISRDVASNDIVSDAADMIGASIKRGGTITDAIKLHEFFPQSIKHAFAAGEQSGNVSEMLSRFSSGIEQDVNDGIQKLITKIEPAAILILSFIVGFILLAIYLPIFDLMKVLHR